jgi:hypothetical protein
VRRLLRFCVLSDDFEYGDFSTVPQPIVPCPTEISQITAAGGVISFAGLPALTPNSLYKGSPARYR